MHMQFNWQKLRLLFTVISINVDDSITRTDLINITQSYWKEKLANYITPVFKEIDFDSTAFAPAVSDHFGVTGGSIVYTPVGYIQFQTVVPYKNAKECKAPFQNKVAELKCMEHSYSMIYAHALDFHFEKTKFAYKGQKYPQLVEITKNNALIGEPKSILDPYGNVLLSFDIKSGNDTFVWSFNTTSQQLKKINNLLEKNTTITNLAPFYNIQNKLNYIYTWHPVVSIDCNGKSCVKARIRDFSDSRITAGSPMVKYKTYFIGLINLQSMCSDGYPAYTPRLVILNSNLDYIYVSERIIFDGKLISEPFFGFASAQAAYENTKARNITAGGLVVGYDNTWIMHLTVFNQKNIVVEAKGLDRFIDSMINAFQTYNSSIPIPNMAQSLADQVDHVCSFAISINDKYKPFLQQVEQINKDYREKNQHYRSIYKCLGKQNVFEQTSRRSCYFEKICYDTKEREFEYYQPLKEPVFYDRVQGPIYEFGNPFIELNAFKNVSNMTYFTPKVVIGELNRNQSVFYDEKTVLWAHLGDDYSSGNLVFEELGAAFITLKRFGIRDNDTQLLNMRGDIDDKLYKQLVEGYGKAISTKPIKGMESHFKKIANGKRYICFKELIVASANRAFVSYQNEFNEGKEVIWEQFRRRVYETHGLDADSPLPAQHGILFVKSKPKDPKKKHEIYNIDEILMEMKKRFPNLKIDTIDPTQLSIKEMLSKLSQFSILVTPSGSNSMLIPFMPKKSQIIVMDYYGDGQEEYQYNPSESASREIAFWNLFPYLSKQYYQIQNPNKDMVPDYENAADYRESFSVKIDPDRLEYMIHKAIMEMDLF
ncbi:hypothetical protein HK103_001796 [Boothiomyces macroporosus]|uniref:Glycosyltransferase 61 catalytic domain-containing protein n=1 Tax=Boothiomyces macroporosus TaxID=261099 RepID=A0AAD5UDN1_9FUNG|nr:hypothetical protein HK103_001796 [Boothiomyces macroporosus]